MNLLRDRTKSRDDVTEVHTESSHVYDVIIAVRKRLLPWRHEQIIFGAKRDEIPTKP